MTRVSGSALRLTVYVGESDTWHHRPVYAELVLRAHAAGLAGATVLRGIESYGQRSLVHTSRVVSLSDDLPVVVVIVDDEAKVRAFLEDVHEVMGSGLVTLDPVEVVPQRGDGGPVPDEGAAGR